MTDNYLNMKEISKLLIFNYIISEIIYDDMEIILYQHLFIYLLIYLFTNLFIWYITSVQFLCVQ